MTNQKIVLHLPTPPSVNALYRNVHGRGRAKTREYENWIKRADDLYLTQKRTIKPLTGPCEIAIRIPASTFGDVSNRIKAAEDFLVSRGVTGDDKHNRKVSIERDASLTGVCVVVITPAREAA